MKEYYDQIFRRKSFHIFTGTEPMTADAVADVENFLETVKPLCPEIGIKTRIVPSNELKGGKGEYCILFYSEEKGDYLRNIGYIGQQLDFYLVSKNIGSLWLGLGKPDIECISGKSFVIMIAMAGVGEGRFRKNMFSAKRKKLDEVWEGDMIPSSDIVRFAPSACNSQPWYVKSENGKISVFRSRKEAKFGIMSEKAVPYFNRIDMGIFLCVLETCLEHDGVEFTRELFSDDGSGMGLIPTAEYTI